MRPAHLYIEFVVFPTNQYNASLFTFVTLSNDLLKPGKTLTMGQNEFLPHRLQQSTEAIFTQDVMMLRLDGKIGELFYYQIVIIKSSFRKTN